MHLLLSLFLDLPLLHTAEFKSTFAKNGNSATEAHVSLVRQMQCTCNGMVNTDQIQHDILCFQLTCSITCTWASSKMGIIKGVHAQIDHLVVCMLKWRQTKKNNQSRNYVIYAQGCLSSMNNQWALGNFESLFNTKVLLHMFENRVPEKKNSKKAKSQVCHWSLNV